MAVALLREYVGTELEKIYNVAAKAHAGQTRKSGGPYISHPIAVTEIIKKFYPGNVTLQKIALLHDTFEDAIEYGNVENEDELLKMILDAADNEQEARQIIRTVLMLTHKKDAAYSDYVIGLINAPLALQVKLSDMLHNLSSSPSERQKLKYSAALDNIKKTSGGIPPSINPEHWNALIGAANNN
jgi:GTP pyrophosphokinase